MSPQHSLDLPADQPVEITPANVACLANRNPDAEGGIEFYMAPQSPVTMTIPLEGPLTFSLDYAYQQAIQPQAAAGYSISVDNLPRDSLCTGFNTVKERLIHDLPAGSHTLKIEVGAKFSPPAG